MELYIKLDNDVFFSVKNIQIHGPFDRIIS
jgi:hypothetical protein